MSLLNKTAIARRSYRGAAVTLDGHYLPPPEDKDGKVWVRTSAIIQVPLSGVRQLFEAGQLVEILPKVKAEPMPLSLIYAHRRNLSKRLQIFMEWLAEILRPHLEKNA